MLCMFVLLFFDAHALFYFLKKGTLILISAYFSKQRDLCFNINSLVLFDFSTNL